MSFLLLGIVRDLPDAQPQHPEISYISAAGLAAAASRISGATPPPPDLATLLEFQRKAEFLHAATAVIPMRYGCYLADEAEVLRHLQSRSAEYLELLHGLEGMSEMGVRLLLPPTPPPARPEPTTPGTTYLAQIRQRQGPDGLSMDELRVADRMAGDVEALWSRRHAEAVSTKDGRLVSVYFLVPKPLVSDFQAAIAKACRPAEAKLLQTGPWPPYNFVGTWSSNTESPLWRALHSSTASASGSSVTG